MAEERDRFSLSRWSRRKLAAKRAPADAPERAPTDATAAVAATAPDAVAPLSSAVVDVAPPIVDEAAAPPLPPVESLSIESDFRPFLAPKVDEDTKRAALRKLFADPHFNVMDGLDVYIDDYNKPDPMPPGMLEKIVGVYDRLAAESAEEKAREAEAEALAATAPSNDDAPATATPPVTDEPPRADALAAQPAPTPHEVIPPCRREAESPRGAPGEG